MNIAENQAKDDISPHLVLELLPGVALRQPIRLAPLILSRYLFGSLSYLICILYLGWGQWGAMGRARIKSFPGQMEPGCEGGQQVGDKR